MTVGELDSDPTLQIDPSRLITPGQREAAVDSL
jgi:hypothetical protein